MTWDGIGLGPRGRARLAASLVLVIVAACGDSLPGALPPATEGGGDDGASTDASATGDDDGGVTTGGTAVQTTSLDGSSDGPGDATTMAVDDTTGGATDPTDDASSDGSPSTSDDGSTSDATSGTVCGDGVIDAGEACDGGNLGGQTCITQGFDMGALSCDAACQLDVSGCADFTCGNGVIEAGESCDGVALGGQTCASQGFFGGPLACTAACAFDTSGCVSSVCGNGTIEGAEACDGVNLGGQTCATEGFDYGTLSCVACSLVTSGCANWTGDCCTAHGTPGCNDDACTAAVCAGDAFCCNNQWDAICAQQAVADCPALCDNCGDGVLDSPAEACDGAALDGQTCVSLGFGAGTLSCSPTCQFDTSLCGAGQSNCCFDHPSAGCSTDICEQAICAVDAFCCTTQWDQLCEDQADAGCPVCGAAGSGDCCSSHDNAGCATLACQTAVCDVDPSCCADAWDEACVAQAEISCAATCTGNTVIRCAATPPDPIPDANPAGVVVPINVPDDGTILDVNVELEISHTYLWDLDVVLQSPAGTNVTIGNNFNDTGGNQCSGDDLVATVDDEALDSIANACNEALPPPVINGTFDPESPLSAVDGQNAMGTWNLVVDDEQAQDTGSVDSVCLVLTLQ